MGPLEEWMQDLRYGGRALIGNPGFTALAGLTLALGVAATTAVFSVTDAVLLRPLPYPDADRLVALYATDRSTGEDEGSVSGANYLDWQAASDSFEQLAAFRVIDFALLGGDKPLRVRGVSVTPSFFSVLGVEAELGRVLSPEIDTPQGDRTVVLGHALWQSQFGGSREVLGSPLSLNGELFTVVGIMPVGFAFPPRSELWSSPRSRVADPPFSFADNPEENRNGDYLSVVARLRANVGRDAAVAEMRDLAARLEREYPEANAGEGCAVVPLRDAVVGETRSQLLLLLGAVVFVLAIAAANVANLLLVRASLRDREIAIRRMLGAGGWRLVRQLLTESLLLAIFGGLAGYLLSLWGTAGLLALAPEGIPRFEEVGIDPRIFAFALSAAVVAGLCCGLLPAWQAVRRDLSTATREGGHAPRHSRFRQWLIVGEVAISFFLLVGALLLTRTLRNLQAVDPGFDPRDTVVMHLSVPESKYREDRELTLFYRRLLERIETLPGVSSVGSVLTLPMHWGLRGTLRFHLEGQPSEPGEETAAGFQIVSPGYFATLRIPLLSGRLLSAADDAGAPPVALVNETFARAFWPAENALGKRLTWDDPEADDAEWVRVVGIVADTRLEGLDRPPVAESYLPYGQAVMPFTTLVVRGELEPAALQRAVREAVWEIDPEQPVHGITTLTEVLAESVGRRRFSTILLSLFAAAALVMTTVGLFGTLSFSVAQRSREIAVRRALGARTHSLVLGVLREAAGLILCGLALGSAGTLVWSRWLASQLYGISATDPPSFLVGVLLTLLSLAACATPALRACRVEPMEALRGD